MHGILIYLIGLLIYLIVLNFLVVVGQGIHAEENKRN
jgi:hypothetical protein